MSDSTEGDTMVLYLEILVPALITLIPGLVIHSFIIVINVTDWMRGRSVTPVDLIITSLGISRMCTQFAVTVCFFVYKFFIDYLYAHDTLVTMGGIYYLCSYANIWLTSLLSIVFCLKISNLRTRLFLYLRRMIDQRTVHFIVGSVLLSAINCLLAFLPAFTEENKGVIYNATVDHPAKDCTYINSLYSHTISGFIPFLFCSISSVLLITSLYRHITKMKMSGNLSINLETYYSAMTFVSITFIYTVIYFVGHFVSIYHFYLYCMITVRLNITLGFLPVLHSSYLIYRTAKLRSHMSKILQNVIDFLFQRKDPDTREDIEMVTQ